MLFGVDVPHPCHHSHQHAWLATPSRSHLTILNNSVAGGAQFHRHETESVRLCHTFKVVFHTLIIYLIFSCIALRLSITAYTGSQQSAANYFLGSGQTHCTYLLIRLWMNLDMGPRLRPKQQVDQNFLLHFFWQTMNECKAKQVQTRAIKCRGWLSMGGQWTGASANKSGSSGTQVQTSWAAATAAGTRSWAAPPAAVAIAVAPNYPSTPTAGLHTPRMHHRPPVLDTCPHGHTTCLISIIPPLHPSVYFDLFIWFN